MKRSPLPLRKQPLARSSQPLKRTALKPPTLEAVRAWGSKPRKALPKIGRKGKREQAAIEAFRTAVRTRARGLCEAPWGGYVPSAHGPRPVFIAHSHTSDPHGGAHCHHAWPEDRDAGRHDPDRGLYLCSAAHSWAHANPEDAAQLGLLRPVDPAWEAGSLRKPAKARG